MRRSILVSLALAAVLLPAGPAAAQTKNFRTHLVGEEEAPIPRETPAQGQAIFQVTDEGLRFKVNVANIENVFAAHIHCGASGVAGPVGVTLFMGAVGGGRVQGTLAEGTVTAPDAGNPCGWTDLDDVLAAMEAGLAYVNVHTNDGVGAINTGPGDFPGGEIRGQIH
ncbi:MAG TPA: CHRD domain-containing protein [Actinomycetota bacterium]|nr:CHRD domain-containing protein [Actinomycetota bacterium]